MSNEPTLFDALEKPAPSEPVPPYLLQGGEPHESPFLFAVPHSGRHYPENFKQSSSLTNHQLRLSEDAFVDDLFAGVTDKKAGLLVATYARSYLDLNRASNEIDPDLFLGPLGDIEPELTNRVKAGLGIIPKIISEGMPIYDRKLPVREAIKRVRDTYMPYHETLSMELDERVDTHGIAVLIDCHSMPSGSELGKGKRGQPDIILGDCWGASCTPELTNMAERLFLAEGFRVRRNIPYAGGFATRHYGKPDASIHALQIEVNRRIYMDEERIEKLPHFNDVTACITKITTELQAAVSQIFTTSNKNLKKAAE